MAEGTIIEVVEVVIGKSGNLADQIGLSSRVKDELEKLRNTVSTFQAVVQDAEEKQAQNLAPSYWLKDLKDAVNEADNLLDDFSSEVSRRDLMTQNKEAKEELKLKYCLNLKQWWQRRSFSIGEVSDNSVGITTSTSSMAENHLLPSFPRLSKLCIWGCPQLISMPLFPFLEKLKLYHCSFKPLEQTTRTTATAAAVASTSSSSTHAASSFPPLSKLKSLEIGRMEEHLPEDCIRNLSSLDHLWIYECGGPLLQGIRHLNSLKQLDICSSEIFDLSNGWNESEWQELPSLSSLWLFQLLKLKSLPLELKKFTFLRKLTIDHCPCLVKIPEWISSLKSLEVLEILQCPKVMSLPVEISHLTSLHTLKICCCPILLRRCKKGIGADWSKIEQIQNLYLEEGFRTK